MGRYNPTKKEMRKGLRDYKNALRFLATKEDNPYGIGSPDPYQDYLTDLPFLMLRWEREESELGGKFHGI